MALNIAASQMMVNPVDQLIEGRALRQAEEETNLRMRTIENAEGRAEAEEQRQQSRFNWEQEGIKDKFDQASAARAQAGANQVLAIPKGQRKAFVEKNFPDFVTALSEQEYGWDEVDEDEIEDMAQGIAAQTSAFLGQSPAKAAPQSDAGKVAADVRSGLLTQGQGDAILNASEYTAPEAGVIDGKEVMFRTDKKSGKVQVLEGVSPRALPGKPDKGFDRANVLRDEYNTQTKDFAVIGDAYERLKSVSADPSAAGDLALIFSYMKILDPGSVVREQEFANAQNAAGIPERVRAAYNKALTGERLPPAQRADFLKQANNLYLGQEKRQQKVRQRYEGLAKKFDIDPEWVTGGAEDQPAAPPQARTQAPAAAIQALQSDPSLAAQFKEKYGYLPGGE